MSNPAILALFVVAFIAAIHALVTCRANPNPEQING
jgi:hypothetical protein